MEFPHLAITSHPLCSLFPLCIWWCCYGARTHFRQNVAVQFSAWLEIKRVSPSLSSFRRDSAAPTQLLRPAIQLMMMLFMSVYLSAQKKQGYKGRTTSLQFNFVEDLLFSLDPLIFDIKYKHQMVGGGTESSFDQDSGLFLSSHSVE